MQPVHELINRIHWDAEYAKGEFEIWFLDHKEQGLFKLPFKDVTFVPGDHYFFHYVDDEGDEHNVPYHRIKAIYKNGELIWHREH